MANIENIKRKFIGNCSWIMHYNLTEMEKKILFEFYSIGRYRWGLRNLIVVKAEAALLILEDLLKYQRRTGWHMKGGKTRMHSIQPCFWQSKINPIIPFQ